MAVDGSGNVYATDSVNRTIRKITPSGLVTTLAGLAGSRGSTDATGSAARFDVPAGVAVDGSGNVYVSEYFNNTIRRITRTGIVTTLAGNPGSPGSTDGTGGTARFFHPFALTVDGSGNVYVGDTGNYTIRKITPAGMVSTLAGTVGISGSADGTGSSAQFHFLFGGLAVDSGGNVYLGDDYNGTIRKLTPTGIVTTLAGTVSSFGSIDGTGSAARFGGQGGMTIDDNGNLYVGDSGTIRRITSAGTVTTLAGTASAYGYTDGIGAAARFNGIYGVAIDVNGTLYIADQINSTIRKMTPSGVVTTLAGTAADSRLGSADGIGRSARFFDAAGLAVDGSGNVYVTDGGCLCTPLVGNHTIRKITPTGVVTTLAGFAGLAGSNDGTGSTARFHSPSGVAVDSNGTVYVGDTGNYTIRKITPGGAVTTLAGQAGLYGTTDGVGSAARFGYIYDVAVDGGGNIYVVDGGGNQTIRKITPAGVVTTLAGTPGSSGSADGTGSAARFNWPQGVAVDNGGNVYVADSQNSTIRKITPGGVVTTLAGLAGASGRDDGTGSAARFDYPAGIAVDGNGNAYVADGHANTIRKITPAGVVTTIGGTPGLFGSDEGTGDSAQFYFPSRLAVGISGNIYVGSNGAILEGASAIDDAANLDGALNGGTRVLGTSPNTATAWEWALIRRPAGSSAELSSTSVRNPTFTPDVAGLFVFRLKAINSMGARISTVSFLANQAASSRGRAVRH
ncbi:MAG TPA: NHL repeat-containing protein [Thermoanaerobaculia bacterium]